MASNEAEAARLQDILDTEENPPPLTRWDEPLIGISPEGQAVWHDRLKHDQKDPAPADRTIRYWVGRWVENQKARAQAKEIAPDRYSSYRYAIEHVRDFAGAENDIETLTADLVERYFNHLLDLIAKRDNDPEGKAGCARTYAKARLDAVKQFCQWLDERDLVPLPKNLRNRKALRIKLGIGKREIYPVKDIKAVLADEETPERDKFSSSKFGYVWRCAVSRS